MKTKIAFFTFSLLLISLLVSCRANSQFSKLPPLALVMETYTNNRYSIQYPKDWQYQEGRINFLMQRLNESGGTASMVNVTVGTPSDLGFGTDIKSCVDEIVWGIEAKFGKVKAVTFKGNDAVEYISSNQEGPYPYLIRFVVYTDEYVWDIVGRFANTDDNKIGEYIISTLFIK